MISAWCIISDVLSSPVGAVSIDCKPPTHLFLSVSVFLLVFLIYTQNSFEKKRAWRQKKIAFSTGVCCL